MNTKRFCDCGCDPPEEIPEGARIDCKALPGHRQTKHQKKRAAEKVLEDEALKLWCKEWDRDHPEILMRILNRVQINLNRGDRWISISAIIGYLRTTDKLTIRNVMGVYYRSQILKNLPHLRKYFRGE